MYKHVIILITATLCTMTVFAQETDKVILEDQTSYRGRVVEQKPGEYIKLVLEGTSDTVTFRMHEIERLMKVSDQMNRIEEKDAGSTGSDFNQHRFMVTVGGSTGGGDVAFAGLHIGLDHQSLPGLFLGVAAEYLGESGSGISAPYQWQKIPVYLNVRYELEHTFGGRGALFARTGVGYSFTLDNEYKDPDSNETFTVTNGLALKPGLGYRVNLLKNSGLMIEVNYLLILDNIKDAADQKAKSNNWSNIQVSASLFF